MSHPRAEIANERALRSSDQFLIATMKLQIEKLRRQIYGPPAERTKRLPELEIRPLARDRTASRSIDALFTECLREKAATQR